MTGIIMRCRLVVLQAYCTPRLDFPTVYLKDAEGLKSLILWVVTLRPV